MKKTIALLLLLSVILSLGQTAIPQAQAATTPGGPWDVDGDGTLSVLAIGNSFSEDILAYVWNIANDLGISDIYLGNLYGDDLSLADHWENANGDRVEYTYYTNSDGTWVTNPRYRMSTALTSRSWDYVTLQQFSDDSGREETYNEDLLNLVKYVKAACPKSKLVWNMTWAYEDGSDWLKETAYSDHKSMYLNIASAVMTMIDTNSDFDVIIPVGAAIENVRTSLLRDMVCEENGYRLSKDIGQYVAGLTFVQALTGLDAWECEWRPDSSIYAWQIISMESASNAIERPFSITKSEHEDVETSLLYMTASEKANGDATMPRMLPYWHKGAHFNNSTSTTYITGSRTDFWCTNRYSQTHMPVGTVITVAEGYKFRLEGLSSANTKRGTEYTGPNSVTIKDKHWNGDYTYYGINISTSSDHDKGKEADLSNFVESTINNALKIYFPLGTGTVTNTNKYIRWKYPVNKSKFWNCVQSTGTNYNADTGDHNPIKYWCTNRFTQDQLPTNTIIYVHSAWEYRPERWTNASDKFSGDRLAYMDDYYMRVSQGFWTIKDDGTEGGRRAFNIRRDDKADISGYTTEQIRDVFRIYLPASYHTHGSYTLKSTTAATCYQAGSKTYECGSCYHQYSDPIAKTSHNPTIILPAVEPTCTATGLTEGKKCSVAACGAITTAQDVLDALGHDETIDAAKDPTCIATGLTVGSHCVRCSSTLIPQEEINKLYHTDCNYDGICDGNKCEYPTSAHTQDTVLDFNLPTEINALEQTALDDVGKELLDDAVLLSVSFVDSNDAKYGSLALFDSDGNGKNDSVKFVSSSMISKLIHVNAVVEFDGNDNHTYQRLVPLAIAPAPVAYYEADSRVIQTNVVTTDTDSKYQWTTVGATVDLSQNLTDKNGSYGYSDAYAGSSDYSAGSSMFVHGSGVPNVIYDSNGKMLIDPNCKKYTEASFTFTGTGFEIISQTGPDQGALRVLVCDQNGYVVKNASVINTGLNNLYQIPVVSLKMDSYGTYTVHVYVNAAYDNADFPILKRGGEFYFDAVRIYNAVDTGANDADSSYVYSIYQAHGEADPTFVEIRDKLIDPNSFDPAEGDMQGAFYLDWETNTGKAELTDYIEVGPNNEVYMPNGNAIMFKLAVYGDIPARLDIGARSADGASVTLCTVVDTKREILFSTNGTQIQSRTAMYYPLPESEWNTGTDEDGNTYHYVYVGVWNNGSGILSITDIKFGYDTPKNGDERSCELLVDRGMVDALGLNDVKDENLTLDMAVSVGAEMQVVFTVKESQVEDFESFCVEVVKDVAGGESVKTVFSPDNGNVTELYAPNGNLVGYSLTYTGINAMEMGDRFTATLYAIAQDGTRHYGQSVSSSIKSYLMEKLSDSTASDELKTLAVDMLNYGAAAQANFGYDTENLVNADLTEDQKTLGTQGIAVATDAMVTSGKGGRIMASVSLQSKVLLYVNCNYAKTENSNLEFVVKNLNGDILERFAPSLEMAKICQGVYSNVGARQMRDLITIELYDNGKLVSQTLTWNIESYVAQTRANSTSSEALVATVNAMLAYGDSAAAYLSASGQ